jgi:hypothetical protein
VAEVPFADHARGVAPGAERLREEHLADREGQRVGRRRAVGGRIAEQPVARRIAAGEQRGPCRGTIRRRCVELREACALRRESIEGGGAVLRVPVAAEVTPAEVVGEDENEIGRGRRRLGSRNRRGPDRRETG